MKKFAAAFSLIELLIALALSSVIMMGLVHINRNAAHLLKEAQSLLVVNRQVALLYAQLERDVTSSVVYQKPEKYAPAKKQPKKGEEGKEEAPKEAEKKDKEQPKEKEAPSVASLSLEPYEDSSYKVGTKKWQQTKKLSLLTTTPLEVYEQEHPRLVRVFYELVYDKKRSTSQKPVYVLYRSQTEELENVFCKEEEDKKDKRVSRCIIADRIKQFSLEAAYEVRPRDEKGPAGQQAAAPQASSAVDPEEMTKVFTWGEEEEKKKSKTVLPDHFVSHIEVWDLAITRSYSFSCLLPLFVKIPAVDEKKEKEKEKKEEGQKGEAEKGVPEVKSDAKKEAPKSPVAAAPGVKEQKHAA